MADPQTSNQKRRQWQLECLGHSLIEILAGLLPGPWVFSLGEFLGGLVWLVMPKRRKIVIRNLRIACAGKKSLKEIHQLAKASFRRAGANLISAAYTSRLSPANLGRVIDIKNSELLEQALAQGKGTVILLSHMGNWELLSRLVHLFPKGSKTGAFYRPLNNEILNDRVLARRQADGTRMFSKRDPFHQVCSFLREGGIVGILADQRVGTQGEICPFFGRLTRVSPLPSLLARRTKSEVLALSLATVHPGKWQATFLPVAPPASSIQCMSALEQVMASSITDVFWLQERWKIYINRNATLPAWLGENSQGDKPHRLLIWIDASSADWQIPASLIHPDVTYEFAAPLGTTPPLDLPANTRIHTLPQFVKPNDIHSWIAKIDKAETLPLDLVLCHCESKALTNACREELIPFIPLS